MSSSDGVDQPVGSGIDPHGGHDFRARCVSCGYNLHARTHRCCRFQGPRRSPLRKLMWRKKKRSGPFRSGHGSSFELFFLDCGIVWSGPVKLYSSERYNYRTGNPRLSDTANPPEQALGRKRTLLSGGVHTIQALLECQRKSAAFLT